MYYLPFINFKSLFPRLQIKNLTIHFFFFFSFENVSCCKQYSGRLDGQVCKHHIHLSAQFFLQWYLHSIWMVRVKQEGPIPFSLQFKVSANGAPKCVF